MKFWKVGIVIVMITMSLFFAGCNLFIQDGSSGAAFIAYSWVYTPEYLYTEDPAFPGRSMVYSGKYVKTRKGTYYFEYIAWDGSGWFGEYTITVEKGEDGKLFSPGDDGEDSYFELTLYSSGPTFYKWTEDQANSRNIVMESVPDNGFADAQKTETELSGEGVVRNISAAVAGSSQRETDINRSDDWDNTQVLTSGKYTVVLNSKKIR